MKVFLKYFFSKSEEDANWLIYWYALHGDIYNDGKKRYRRIKKGHDGKKWREL
jgi:hypothetical protein